MNQVFHSNRGWIDNLRVFIPELWMTVHAGTFWLWIGTPQWFIDAIAYLTYNYIFLGLCGILVFGMYISYEAESDDILVKSKNLFTNAMIWSIIGVFCVQAFFPRGVYKFYLLLMIPFISLLFDYKNLKFDDADFQFQPHYLFPLIYSWAIFLCNRFVYLWLINLGILFYLWKSGELNRFLSSMRVAKQPDSEWDEIYSDVSYTEVGAEDSDTSTT
jgi:hypothetical protein